MAKLPKAQLLGEHGPDSQTPQVPPPTPRIPGGCHWPRFGGDSSAAGGRGRAARAPCPQSRTRALRAHSVRTRSGPRAHAARNACAFRSRSTRSRMSGCSRARPGPTFPARPRRTTSLFCDGGGWPAFSGGPAALERARASLLSLSFNALDHSPDDLTVLIGELFLQEDLTVLIGELFLQV